MKVLIDTNIILDVLLSRQKWLNEATTIWQAHQKGEFVGYVTAFSITNISYIAYRHTKARGKALKAVRVCLDEFQICDTNMKVLDAAYFMTGKDFEDNGQIASAQNFGLDAIVTRDLKGFQTAKIPVYDPINFLQELSKWRKHE